MRPGPHAHAIRSVVRDLIDTRDGVTYFAQKIAGVWLHYDLPGDHPLIGRSAPDVEFEDGTRLGALLHQGKAVLLDLEEREELERLAREWKGRVKYVRARAKDALGLSALMVRPDGFVVWVAEGVPDSELARALMATWFGKND